MSVLSFGRQVEAPKIAVLDNRIVLSADILQKQLRIEGSNLFIDSYMLDGRSLVGDGSCELSLRITKASPNEEPLGIVEDPDFGYDPNESSQNWYKAMNDPGRISAIRQNVTWIDTVLLQSDRWGTVFQKANCIVSQPGSGTKRLNIRFATLEYSGLPDLTVNICYELYDGHPSIRKWVEISNNSAQWLKIDQLTLDGLVISDGFQTKTDLTPTKAGACSSIISYSNSDCSVGIITGSEIPSGIRIITPEGCMGYSEAYFERVIGPAERFVSEPVFHYAYSGETNPTASAVSTTLDRTVESAFRDFLYGCVGVKQVDVSPFVPLWCSWSNFGPFLNEKNMSEVAELAGQCGFRGFLIDGGWGTNTGGFCPVSLMPDVNKFPDFKALADHIRLQGLTLGLWVSCFRYPSIDPDFVVIPDAFSLPRLTQPMLMPSDGLAMSFASKWRYYYASSLLKLRDQYGAAYFKQDLSNIRFGDIARSHDSRTLKESYLRGLGGIFEAQDIVSEAAPDINLELTHEIYWGTPGVPCDIAALKHAHTFHIPPNTFENFGHISEQQKAKGESFLTDSLRSLLLLNCFQARNIFFESRGLPLQNLEFYCAATVNTLGSLTPDIQRRQVCSWLFGAPSVFAGNLSTLTAENIETYRACFSVVDELNQKYGIYSHFQYSGVPAPTDDDWHWWGKLNAEGAGAVVVIRGKGGDNERKINIPWVDPGKKYQIYSCFTGRLIGDFSGNDLINGQLTVALPPYGQDILEIRY